LRGSLRYHLRIAQAAHNSPRRCVAGVAADGQSEKRLTLERALRPSRRLPVIGRLAAGSAHEMGAPLNMIT
jgi:hypothetical protein